MPKNKLDDRPVMEADETEKITAVVENPIQFLSDRTMAGAVSKDGSMALIEFVGGGQRFWLTIPAPGLKDLRDLCERLEAMAIDATGGIASKWHHCTNE